MFEPPQGSTDNDGGPGSAWTPRAPQLHPAPPFSPSHLDCRHRLPSSFGRNEGFGEIFYATMLNWNPPVKRTGVIGTVTVRTHVRYSTLL